MYGPHISSTPPLLQWVNRWKTFASTCSIHPTVVVHNIFGSETNYSGNSNLNTSDTFTCNTILIDCENQNVYSDHSVSINSGVLQTHKLWAPKSLQGACVHIWGGVEEELYFTFSSSVHAYTTETLMVCQDTDYRLGNFLFIWSVGLVIGSYSNICFGHHKSIYAPVACI